MSMHLFWFSYHRNLFKMTSLREKGIRFFTKQPFSKEVLEYDDAIKALNLLQSNASTIRKSIENNTARLHNVDDTNKYLKRCGLELEEFQRRIPVIHVAGTKGKGSTCALCESVLRSHGYRTGLFTSPHLINVTERININGAPLSSSEFVNHFWPIYNTLANNKENDNDMPTYFKFLTVMAFSVFLKEMVDVAIFEVGIGGEYDCTNVLRKTPVVGISSLGLDHTSILGSTLDKIAWQKAGIMKSGSNVFTVSDHHPSALQVLEERAKERNCRLTIVPNVTEYNWDVNQFGPSHKLNASLAIQLAHAWIKLKNNISWDVLPIVDVDEKTINAILSCQWAGRFQTLKRGQQTYYLDGAHTRESTDYCADWFISQVPKSPDHKRILVFNLTKQRDATTLLVPFTKCGFDKVIFSPNNLTTDSSISPQDLLDVSVNADSVRQKLLEYKSIWEKMCRDSSQNVTVASSVIDALTEVESGDSINHILVTGSLHLVGSVLSAFHCKPSNSLGS